MTNARPARLAIASVGTALTVLLACASADDGPAEEPAPPWTPRDQEPELGQIRWGRSYDEARAEARRVGKPMLVLFDEVPG